MATRGFNRDFLVRFKGDTKGLEGAVKGISGRLDRIDKQVTKLGKLGGVTGAVLGGVGLGAGLGIFSAVERGVGAVVDGVADAIDAASDWGEATSKVNVVFGEQASVIQRWARSAATSIGIAEREALKAAGTFGNLFDALGLSEQATLDMSKGVIQLAADLASFNNVATDEVLTALQSGLLGEAEPMRRFGSSLTAARVEAYGLANNLYDLVKVGGKTKAVMSDAQKVQARYALILEDTKNAQGDFALTSDGLANSQKILDARVDDLRVQFGKLLQGPAKGFIRFLGDVVTGIENIQEALGDNQRKVDTWDEKLELLGERYGFTAKQAHDFDEAIQNVWPTDWTDAQKTEASLHNIEARMISVRRGAQVAGRGIREDFGGALGSTGDGIVRFTTDVRSLPAVMTAAVVDMKAAIKNGKAGIIEQFRDLAWQSKHPFAAVNYGAWLQQKHAEAMRKSKEAAKAGKPGVASQYSTLADEVLEEWRRVPGAMSGITRRALRALQPVFSKVQNITPLLAGQWTWHATEGGDGSGTWKPGKGWTPDRKKKPKPKKPKHKALGGPVRSGHPYIVGERGPELLRMGDQSGHITPNHRLGRGGDIYIGAIHVHATAGSDLSGFGRQVTEALRAYARNGGGAAIRAAVSG